MLNLWLWCAGIALLSVAGTPIAQGPAPNQPDNDEPTILLVARPEPTNTNYRRTVLLVMPLGPERHIGFIINRSTRQSLSTFFPKYDPAKR